MLFAAGIDLSSCNTVAKLALGDENPHKSTEGKDYAPPPHFVSPHSSSHRPRRRLHPHHLRRRLRPQQYPHHLSTPRYHQGPDASHLRQQQRASNLHLRLSSHLYPPRPPRQPNHHLQTPTRRRQSAKSESGARKQRPENFLRRQTDPHLPGRPQHSSTRRR